MNSVTASDSMPVTVLMPVFNGAPYLYEAIDSILAQTFSSFELLVVDDGSKDETPEILAGIDDRRLRVIRNDHNEGIVRALNRGLDHARGRLIARMDADDVSLPVRLAKQVEYLDRNPTVGAVGSWVASMGGEFENIWTTPTDPDDVRAELLFACPIAHPSVVLRRGLFEAHGLRYDDAYWHAEDYELWMRASERFPIANMGEVLVRYRCHRESVSRRNNHLQQESTARIQSEALARLGVTPTEGQLRIHRWLVARAPVEVDFGLCDVEAWLERLLSANDERRAFPVRALRHCIGDYWFKAAIQMRATGPSAISHFFGSPLSRCVEIRQRIRLGLGLIKRAIL